MAFPESPVEGQIYKNFIYKTNKWSTLQITNVSDSSRICNISGDGVPEMPDGGIVYKSNFNTPDGWQANSTTYTQSNGTGIFTYSGGGNPYYPLTMGEGMISITLKTKVSTAISIKGTVGGVPSSVIKSVLVSPGIKTTISGYVPDLGGIIYVEVNSQTSGEVLTVYDFYAGTGLYSSKVYDMSGNGNNFTNNNCLPVASPDGKGLLFNGTTSFLQAKDSVIGNSGSIFVKFNRTVLDTGTARPLFSTANASTGLNGVTAFFNMPTQLVVTVANLSSNIAILIPIASDYFWHTLALTLNGTSGTYSLDGNTPVAFTCPALTSTHDKPLRLGSTELPSQKLYGTISHFRYDSKIWTSEEMYKLYLDPNGVDSQVKSIVPTPNAIQVFGSSGETINSDINGVRYVTKKFTGTTSSTEGGTVSVLHGISAGKALSVTGLVFYLNTSSVSPGYTASAGYEFSLDIGSTQVGINNHPTNSELILTKPFVVWLTYEV